MIIKKCKCGCNELIKIKNHHRWYGVPNYIKGHNMVGIKRDDKTIKKQSESSIGEKNPMYGVHRFGEKSPTWKGGLSFEEYPQEFNKKLKNKIRKRDNFICQECNFTETQLRHKLSVHHIDYNKKNNNLDNLISLCKSCHSQTNFSREDWTKYFGGKLKL